jgi:hypothetical protein
MTISLDDDCTVLAEFRWGREVLQIVHTPDDEYPRRHGGYQYAVRWNHTSEIRCNTEDSAWTLFDVLLATGENPSWVWMFTS